LSVEVYLFDESLPNVLVILLKLQVLDILDSKYIFKPKLDVLIDGEALVVEEDDQHCQSVLAILSEVVSVRLEVFEFVHPSL
jgi:hypothetical protein